MFNNFNVQKLVLFIEIVELLVVNTFTTHVPEIPIEETHENNGVRGDASNRHSRRAWYSTSDFVLTRHTKLNRIAFSRSTLISHASLYIALL